MYRCRKNQTMLTAQEKSHFVAAVLALKASGKYDQYIQDHVNFMPNAHRGPAFLPWHREFLRRFELDLQAIDSTVTLPYWDWTVDNSPTLSIWDINFMGGNGRPSDGRVMTGPFAFSTGNWTLIIDGPALRRRFGGAISSLPTPSDVTAALTGPAATPYDVAPYNINSASGFRNLLEGWINGPQLHNRVHVWVGGSMGPASSPNDPVFFLHHCFVDKLWADWQALHPTEGYLPSSGALTGHNLADPMQPWQSRGEVITPASVLDHHALGYAYDTESVCAPKLKFRDDPIKLKFIDDQGKRKFIDDPIKLKVLDDPGKFKFIDDRLMKQPGLDMTVGANRPNIALARGGREAVPFVLSTPHHSMAWAQSFPGAHRTSITQYESTIAQYEQTIREINQAYENGQLSEADMHNAANIYQEYQALLAEYQQLRQQSR